MNLRWIFKNYIFNNSKLIILTLFFISVIQWIIQTANPKIISNFIDMLTNSGDTGKFHDYIKILIGLSIIEILIMLFNTIFISKLKLKSNIRFLNYVFSKLYKIDYVTFQSKDYGYLAQQVVQDCNYLISFVIDNASGVFVNIFLFSISLVMILKININIGIFSLLIIPIYIVSYFLAKKHLYKSIYIRKEKENLFFSTVLNVLKNMKLIKLNVLDKYSESLLNGSYKSLFDASMDFAKKTFLFSSTDSMYSKIFTIVVYLIGGYSLIHKQLSIGDFLAITMYFSMCIGSIKVFFNLGKEYQNAKSSLTRLNSLIAFTSENSGEIKVEDINYIELNEVSFEINGNSILENFSCKFEKGKIYKLKGKNGVGKTTLLNLISGLYQYSEGNIKVNEVNLKNIDIYDYREKKISLISQEEMFFNDTSINNINVVDKYIDEKDLAKLIDVFNIDSEIIEKNINQLSGGQKQKINLCRGLSRKNEVLILDEPSTFLDSVSTDTLERYLAEIKNAKIIIIVTHDNLYDNIIDQTIDMDLMNVKSKEI